jgi:hypothetical protein
VVGQPLITQEATAMINARGEESHRTTTPYASVYASVRGQQSGHCELALFTQQARVHTQHVT